MTPLLQAALGAATTDPDHPLSNTDRARRREVDPAQAGKCHRNGSGGSVLFLRSEDYFVSFLSVIFYGL